MIKKCKRCGSKENLLLFDGYCSKCIKEIAKSTNLGCRDDGRKN